MFKLLLVTSIMMINGQTDIVSCETCECYQVQCNTIKDADIDCENSFKKSCDRKRFFLKNDFCNEVCDCCIEGKCLKWNQYYCFIYKSYEFFAGIFFLLGSVNLILINIVHQYFTKIKRKFNKVYFRIRDKSGEQEAKKDMNEKINEKLNPELMKNKISTDFYKYRMIIYIARHPEIESHSITGTKSKKVMGLFCKMDEIKKIAIQNYIYLGLLCISYCSTIVLGLYLFLTLQDNPIEYGIYAPILFAIFLFFYILIIFSLYVFKDYKTAVIKVLDSFEEEHNCKIRIRKRKSGFEINWNPELIELKKNKKKEKAKAKNNAKKTSNLEEMKLNPKEQSSLKSAKMDFKKNKPKIINNKVTPLSSIQTTSNLTKKSQNNSEEEGVGVYKSRITAKFNNKVHNIKPKKEKNSDEEGSDKK